MGRGSEAVIEAAPVEEVIDERVPDPALYFSPLVRLTAQVILGALLFGMPLFFGAVHSAPFSISMFLAALLPVLFFATVPKRVAGSFAGTTSRLVLVSLLAAFCYASGQALLFSVLSTPHPVFGSVSRVPDWEAFRGGLLSIAFFTTAYIAVRVWLFTNTQNAERLLGAIFASGLMVSLIALSHWFYDNGKLFWTFAPTHVFSSPRARWPFVNSNHLAHFLLPISLLFLVMVRKRFEDIQQVLIHAPAHLKRSFSNLIGNRKLQRSALALTFHLSFLCAAVLCIAGSLSRGSWLGFAVALLLFALRRKVFGFAPSPSQRGEPARVISIPGLARLESERPSSRRRRSKQRRGGNMAAHERTYLEALFGWLRRMSTPLTLLFAAAAFLFFMNGRGGELIEARLEYGLLYSHDDMRWQLYGDSVPLIKDYLWFGTGLGGWAAVFPRYMSQLLSGVEPQYLHSEPLQLLAEFGVIGFSLISAAIILFFRALIRAARAAREEEKATLSGLILGGIALLVASAFDFPFRIPAICFFTACYLALAAFYSDRVAGRPKEN